jgi:hypothetical protein
VVDVVVDPWSVPTAPPEVAPPTGVELVVDAVFDAVVEAEVDSPEFPHPAITVSASSVTPARPTLSDERAVRQVGAIVTNSCVMRRKYRRGNGSGRSWHPLGSELLDSKRRKS